MKKVVRGLVYLAVMLIFVMGEYELQEERDCERASACYYHRASCCRSLHRDARCYAD
jgi:hypothetical protein